MTYTADDMVLRVSLSSGMAANRRSIAVFRFGSAALNPEPATVDWGDGTAVQTLPLNTAVAHTYVAVTGVVDRTIVIKGSAVGTVAGNGEADAGISIFVQPSSTAANYTCIDYEVVQWGNAVKTGIYPCHAAQLPMYLPPYLTTLHGMFSDPNDYNQAVNKNPTNVQFWDTGNIQYMQAMAAQNVGFNVDLSNWCVTQIPTAPTGFASGATAWALPKPQWGTCPARLLDAMGDPFECVLREYGTATSSSIAITVNSSYGDLLVDWGVTAPKRYPAAPTGSTTYSIPMNSAEAQDVAVRVWTIGGSVNILTPIHVQDILAWGTQQITRLALNVRPASAISSTPNEINIPIDSGPQTLTNLGGLFNARAVQQDIQWDLPNALIINTMFQHSRTAGISVSLNVPQVTQCASFCSQNSTPPIPYPTFRSLEISSDAGITTFDSFAAYNTGINCPIYLTTESATGVGSMFRGCTDFNTDLSHLCFPLVASKPSTFDQGATAWTAPQPHFGTPCPSDSPDPTFLPHEFVLWIDPQTYAAGAEATVSIVGATTPSAWNYAVIENGVVRAASTLLGSTPFTLPLDQYSGKYLELRFSLNAGDYLTGDAKFVVDIPDPVLYEVLNWGIGYTLAPQLWRGVIGVPDSIPTEWTSLQGMFTGAHTINDPNISLWDTSNINNLQGFLNGATSFQQPLPWDVSNVMNFDGCFAFNSYNDPSLVGWNTKNAYLMSNMFLNNPAINQDLSVWCVPNIPSLPAGFDTGATAWTQPRPVWGTCTLPANKLLVAPDVTSSRSAETYLLPRLEPREEKTIFMVRENVNGVKPVVTIYLAYGYNTFYIDHGDGQGERAYTGNIFTQAITINTNGPTDLRRVTARVEGRYQGEPQASPRLSVAGCYEVVDWGTTKITRFNFTATAASQLPVYLEKIPDNPPPQITSLAYMFENQRLLNQTINWVLPTVTTAASFMRGCIVFNSPLALYCPELVYGSDMFEGLNSMNSPFTLIAPKLTDGANIFSMWVDFNSSLHVDIPSVTSLYQGFMEWRRFNQPLDLNVPNLENAFHLFRGDYMLNAKVTINSNRITNATQIFSGCVSLSVMPDINLEPATNVYAAFYRCNRLDVSGVWNFPNATNISRVFMETTCTGDITINAPVATNCGEILYGQISGFTTSQVVLNLPNATRLSQAFERNTEFDGSVTINAPLVADISRMFHGCNKFTQALVFSSPYIEQAVEAFYQCTLMQTMPVFSVENLVNANSCFSGCRAMRLDLRWNAPRLEDIGYIANQVGVTTHVDQHKGEVAYIDIIAPELQRLQYAFTRSNVTAQTINIVSDTLVNATAVFYNVLFLGPTTCDISMQNVVGADSMFYNAAQMNADCSHWCVEHITTEPHNFSAGATAWQAQNKPRWGQPCT